MKRKILHMAALPFLLWLNASAQEPAPAPPEPIPASPGDSWAQKSDFVGGGRQGATAFTIGNKCYVGTGHGPVFPYEKKDLWQYDPVTNVWTQVADFGGTARFLSTSFSIGNKGYVGLGTDINGFKNDFWEYDPAINTWAQKASYGGGAQQWATGFSIGNKGYIGTGNAFTYYSKEFWEYDPSSDTWTRKADYGGPATYGAVGFSIGNKGYLGTGYTFDSEWSKQFWEYDPTSDTWTRKADFGGSGRFGGVGFNICNKGYLATGWVASEGNKNDLWEYDPALDSWEKKADFGGGPRWMGTGVSVGNKGYIGLGSPTKSDFWEYSPVSASSLSSVSIQTSGPEDYCYNFVLNAVAAPAGSYNYLWSTGETTSVKVLDNSLADGVYTVRVTDPSGCVTKTASYNYQKQNLTSSYTLLGLKTVYLGERNAVGFGAVGVKSPLGLATFGPNSFVAAPGGFVKSKFILVSPTATIFTKIYAPATVTLPVMQFNTSNVSALPVYNVPAFSTATLNGDYRHLNVGKGAHVTLNGTTFGDIHLSSGSEVTMNGDIINVRNLTLDNGSLAARTMISFASVNRVSLRVSDKVVIGEHCRVVGSNVVFYAGDQRKDLERFTVRARDTHVDANVYIPNGILSVTGNNELGTECLMTGYFIADAIISLGRQVIWNPRFCNVPLPFIVNRERTEQRNTREVNAQNPASQTSLTIFVYPNPSRQNFNIVVQSPNADKLQINIYDLYGRKLEQLSGPCNKTYIFGQQYAAGTYMVEVQRGPEKHTFKLIKL